MLHAVEFELCHSYAPNLLFCPLKSLPWKTRAFLHPNQWVSSHGRQRGTHDPQKACESFIQTFLLCRWLPLFLTPHHPTVVFPITSLTFNLPYSVFGSSSTTERCCVSKSNGRNKPQQRQPSSLPPQLHHHQQTEQLQMHRQRAPPTAAAAVATQVQLVMEEEKVFHHHLQLRQPRLHHRAQSPEQGLVGCHCLGWGVGEHLRRRQDESVLVN